ncbi:unnamed protein product [Amaranthus hypochondriacus]
MGSENSPKKHLYDISKSKRTRRTPVLLAQVDEEPKGERVKLEQLINVDVSERKNPTSNGKDDRDRAILGQYFADEKQLQMVMKQPENGPQRLKVTKIIKRYVKALSKMVKSKNKQCLEKPTLHLTM